MQGFIGWGDWDDAPLRQAWRSQVGQPLGQEDGVCSCLIPRRFQSPGGSPWGWPGSGVAAWAKSITVRWPSPWAPCRAKATRWSISDDTCPRNGRRIKPAWTKLVCPKPAAALAPGTSEPWRCWRAMERRCRMGGLRVTMRWGVRTGFVVGSPLWASGTCEPCLRTRGYGISRASRPSRAAEGDGPIVPGTAWRRGVRRLTRKPGGALMDAMGRKGHWELTASNDGWCRAPIGVSQAMRS